MTTSSIDLAPYLAAYLKLRRALGMKMDAEVGMLEDFVQFIGDRQITGPVTSSLVFDWLDVPKRPPGHAARRLSCVRQFLLYLSAAFPDTQVPEFRLVARYRRPTPFLFSDEEIERLLKCAAEPGQFSSVVTHTVLGLLAATGLRVSEALGLDRSDVMPRNSPDTVLIREAKFHKSRIVPLHETTAEQLRVYAGHRELMGFGRETPAFFVSSHGNRLAYDALRQRFHNLISMAGIQRREGVNGPTVHSLRHTFVVSRLRRWHEEGVDVERRLAHLATYLGHADYRDTYWYMTVTPELLSAATSEFRAPRLEGGAQ
jgi:site-specific recombinase XerD